MLRETSVFLDNQDKGASYVEGIFSRVQKVYKIDDCDITISNAKADVQNSLQPLLSKIGNEGVVQMIKNFRGALNHNIPVMTFEEYLKELKDCIQEDETGEVNLGNLTRILVPVNPTTVVANIIIIGKEEYNGEPILLNELFVEGKYIKTAEYKISELTKEFESIQKPSNIIDKHKRMQGNR